MGHWSRLALFIVPEMSCVTPVGGKGRCIERLDNASALDVSQMFLPQPALPGFQDMKKGPFLHRLQEEFRTPRNMQTTKFNESQIN